MSEVDEQRLLRRSIAVTVLVGACGVVFGVLSGSMSIIFDGVFSVVDASMTGLSLLVARLVVREIGRRFQFGFWHLEPMVVAFNGALLVLLTFYAFVNAVGTLLAGGRELQFGWAIAYAALIATICFTMFATGRRANRRIGSGLVALDVKGWLMSGLITSALLFAFAIALAIEGTSFETWTPYVDPAVLAVLTLVLMPVPMKSMREALADIFLLAPGDLDRRAREVASGICGRYGFTDFRSYVARIGRGRQIEIHFVVPATFQIGEVAVLDAIRAEVADAMGGRVEDRWLTIAFTGDLRWAS